MNSDTLYYNQDYNDDVAIVIWEWMDFGISRLIKENCRYNGNNTYERKDKFP